MNNAAAVGAASYICRAGTGGGGAFKYTPHAAAAGGGGDGGGGGAGSRATVVGTVLCVSHRYSATIRPPAPILVNVSCCCNCKYGNDITTAGEAATAVGAAECAGGIKPAGAAATAVGTADAGANLRDLRNWWTGNGGGGLSTYAYAFLCDFEFRWSRLVSRQAIRCLPWPQHWHVQGCLGSFNGTMPCLRHKSLVRYSTRSTSA